MKFDIEITGKNDVNLLMKALEDTKAAVLKQWGEEAETIAKDEIAGVYGSPKRVDTGNLRGSIGHQEMPSEDCVYIGTNVEYAIWVHEGTGIYAAEGNGRKTPWVYKDEKGKWHFTRGMKPNRFLKNAIQNHLDVYQRIFEENFQ